jgi:hypothetical protein
MLKILKNIILTKKKMIININYIIRVLTAITNKK